MYFFHTRQTVYVNVHKFHVKTPAYITFFLNCTMSVEFACDNLCGKNIGRQCVCWLNEEHIESH